MFIVLLLPVAIICRSCSAELKLVLRGIEVKRERGRGRKRKRDRERGQGES